MEPCPRSRDARWPATRGRAPRRPLLALALAAVLGLAAPAVAQPRDLAPPADGSGGAEPDGVPEDPYGGGAPEDPYGGGAPEDPYGGAPEDPYGDEASAPLADDSNDDGDDAGGGDFENREAPRADPLADDSNDDGEAPDLNTQVAKSLYRRAGVLYDNGDYDNAQMLLNEAAALRPSGSTAAAIEALRREVELRISEREVEENIPVDPYGDDDLDDELDPYGDEQGEDDELPAELLPVDTSAADDLSRGRRTFIVYGGMLGFTLGLAATDLDSSDSSPVLPALLGAGAGLGGAYLFARKRDISAGRASTIAWSGAFSGLVGGVIVDLTAIDDSRTTDVTRGVALGATLGSALGWYAGDRLDPSPGDAALVASMGLYGTAAGLLIGVGIDPVESEAYSINAMVGAGLGLGVGAYLASQSEVSRRRMMWVDLGAALGAATPWVVLYPLFADSNARSDEQAAGVISTLGLAAGGYLAWRLTAGMEPEQIADDSLAAVPGFVRRGADGRWGLGVGLPRPAQNPVLGPHLGGRALAVDLFGGQF